MKFLLAVLLLALPGQALAQECKSPDDLIRATVAGAPENVAIETERVLLGAEADTLEVMFNAQPPATNVDTDSIIVLRALRREDGAVGPARFLILVKDNCVVGTLAVPAQVIDRALQEI